jgi:subtilisin family serine protease
VSLTWTVIGGGTLSSTSTTTGKDGRSKVTWTLAPSTGTQVVTVTSRAISGASVSFVANNGATITGTVSASGASPFGATFSRGASRRTMSAATAATPAHAASDRIVVGFKDGSLGVAAAGAGAYRSISVARSAASRIRQSVAVLAERYPLDDAQVSPAMLAARVRVSDPEQVDATIAALRADPNVAWAERDGTISIHDGAPRPMRADFVRGLDIGGDAPAGRAANPLALATKMPNDKMFWEQTWPAQMLDLPRAWAITTGDPNVVVAVIDMGIRFDHPDIAANLTADGYDFVSQDSYGSTETICGGGTFSTIEGDGDGPDADPTDPDDLEFDTIRNCWRHATLGDHGLWTAGIIGAAGNDATGVTGVSWAVKIRPIRVLGITGEGSSFDIAQGVLYAAGLPATGADGALVQAPSRAPIINMSLGGGSPSYTLNTAVQAASTAGSLVVASAGNDGMDLPSYPAAFDNVMAVASVGMDGALATYSNAGTYISVAAPGGDYRLDDNGGGGVLGPGWNFATGTPTHLFGYGTSAAAPYVSGIAALLLAQTPGLTAAQLRLRIEQYATRATGLTRSDMYGWGIVNAYNALAQQHGAPHSTIAQLVDATTGHIVRTAPVDANGRFAFTRLPNGAFYVQAGDDDNGDGTIGVPGQRFAWAGGFGKPTVFNVNGNASSTAIVLGTPMESEPNDDIAHANVLSVGSWVAGTLTPPDLLDMYVVKIPADGVYTIETSGLVGTCGLGVELDTYISVTRPDGSIVGTNDNFISPTGRFCSRVQASLSPGLYYIGVQAVTTSGMADHGRYRLEVRQ